jgi:hypothetical protein
MPVSACKETAKTIRLARYRALSVRVVGVLLRFLCVWAHACLADCRPVSLRNSAEFEAELGVRE